MEGIIAGMIGMVLALGLLILGAWLGWQGRKRWQEHTVKTAREELSEWEKRELEAEQKAFADLMGYNAHKAYGMPQGAERL